MVKFEKASGLSAPTHFFFFCLHLKQERGNMMKLVFILILWLLLLIISVNDKIKGSFEMLYGFVLLLWMF